MSTIKDALSRANLNTLSDLLRTIDLGAVLRALRCHLFNVAPATGQSPYAGAAKYSVLLPADAKCAKVESFYVRGGTTKGAYTLSADNTPATTEYYVTPSGDLTCLSTDAITKADIVYMPVKGDVVDLTLPVVTNDATIPTSITDRGVILAAEVESLAGTLVQKMEVVAHSDSAPTTGLACLTVAKDKVKFATADAVTSCRLKLIVAPAIDVNAKLESTDSTLV